MQKLNSATYMFVCLSLLLLIITEVKTGFFPSFSSSSSCQRFPFFRGLLNLMEYEPPSPSWLAVCTLTFSLLSFTIPSRYADFWHRKASCIFQGRPAGGLGADPGLPLPLVVLHSQLQRHGQQLYKKKKCNYLKGKLILPLFPFLGVIMFLCLWKNRSSSLPQKNTAPEMHRQWSCL